MGRTNQTVEELLSNYVADKDVEIIVDEYLPNRNNLYTGTGRKSNPISQNILDRKVDVWFGYDDGGIEIQVERL